MSLLSAAICATEVTNVDVTDAPFVKESNGWSIVVCTRRPRRV
jgi:hypothetical protein